MKILYDQPVAEINIVGSTHLFLFQAERLEGAPHWLALSNQDGIACDDANDQPRQVYDLGPAYGHGSVPKFAALQDAYVDLRLRGTLSEKVSEISANWPRLYRKFTVMLTR